ncbi:hypothetical protein Tco_0346743 [Tanacetum coccineum]
MGSFIKWYCRQIGKLKVTGLCLIWVNPYLWEVHLVSNKERRSALSISKLKAAYYLDFGLEELVPSQWIESEHEYDINAAYGITYWWFKRKKFYITSHNATSDRYAVISHM